jgi:single-strand DNA-binding protein
MIAACVTGNVTKDAELKTTEGGPLLVFSVASRRWAKGAEETDFVDIALFGKRAESLAKHVTKGSRVAVRGALGLRKYKTRDGRDGAALEIRADEVDLLGGGRRDDDAGF